MTQQLVNFFGTGNSPNLTLVLSTNGPGWQPFSIAYGQKGNVPYSADVSNAWSTWNIIDENNNYYGTVTLSSDGDTVWWNNYVGGNGYYLGGIDLQYNAPNQAYQLSCAKIFTPVNSNGPFPDAPRAIPAVYKGTDKPIQLHVNKDKILDEFDREITLKGVVRPSLEWNPQGQFLSPADIGNMAKWGSNVIRLDLNQNFWFNSASVNVKGSYKQIIDAIIYYATQNNMAVILDLHWTVTGQQSPMADPASLFFWKEVAETYGNFGTVIFELFNEPYGIDQDTWLSGNNQYVGYQQLHDAVRGTGANNLVIVGGLDYAYDLSFVSPIFKVNGFNIIYNSHPYDAKGEPGYTGLGGTFAQCYAGIIGNFPLMFTEFGANESQYYPNGYQTVYQQALDYINSVNGHYTAFAWWVQHNNPEFPTLISDWSGIPLNGGILVNQDLKQNPPTNFFTPPNFLLSKTPAPLQYNFILDQSRCNQQLQLINNTNASIVLQSIQITTNANIQSPWQLFGTQWQNVQITQDNELFVYTLPLSPPINIPPGTMPVLEYSVTATGNLGFIPSIALPPTQFFIQLQDNNYWQNVELMGSNQQTNPHPGVLFTVYHAEWGQYAYQQNMTTEDWAQINSLNYSFYEFDENGNVCTPDYWADQLELPLLDLAQQRLPYLQSSISFGGWSFNGNLMAPVFSVMAANPTARQNFVTGAAAVVHQMQVKGVNIDWEYVQSGDVTNFIVLLQELRSALPAGSKLSIIAPAGINNIQVFTSAQWQQIAALVDEIDVMCYDYFGGFSTYADFHAPWQLSPNSPDYNTEFDITHTLQAYQNMGVPIQKMTMGIPNYARSVIVAEPGDYAGLYQPVIGTPQGDFPGANGIYSWNSIYNFLNNQPSPLDQLGVTQWEYYDSTHPLCVDAKMCLLAGKMPNGQWVLLNFLDPFSANARAQQAMQLGLGGASVWANYFDTKNLQNSIINAISNGLSNNKFDLSFAQQFKLGETTSQKDIIKKHANDLKKNFFSREKSRVFEEMSQTESWMALKQIIDKNQKTLAVHRNIFKRFLSFFLPKETMEKFFGKTTSLTLAENFLQALKKPTTNIIKKILPKPSTEKEIISNDPPNEFVFKSFYLPQYSAKPDQLSSNKKEMATYLHQLRST